MFDLDGLIYFTQFVELDLRCDIGELEIPGLLSFPELEGIYEISTIDKLGMRLCNPPY